MVFNAGFENAVQPNMTSKIPLAKKGTPARIKMWINVLFILTVMVASFIHLDVNPIEILLAPPGMLRFLVDNFFPPHTAILANVLPIIVDTLFFAIVSTYISGILSFILGILMSECLNANKALRSIVRYFVSFLRNIPVLIWGSLLVFIFGIGNMVGLLALIIATMGFLSRSYAESMDDIANERLEALYASGASYMQILVHGLIPEFFPSWLNWTLFSFEINIRASAILGMVGAGGIGMLIQSQLNMRNFTSASTLIITLVVLVLMTEFSVGAIRKRLAGGK